MEINNLVKRATIYSVIFFAVIFLVGMVFFRKENNEAQQEEIILTKQENIINQDIENKTSSRKIEIEKEKAEIILKSFLVAYNSYTYGDFSNIESLYSFMTEEMQNREKNNIEKMKQEISSQEEYTTVIAETLNSEVVFFNEQEITIKIFLEMKYFAGAILQDPKPENEDNIKTVNKKGEDYKGNFDDLLEKTEYKNFEVNGILKEDGWKVKEIIIIK